jgi:hypothetical protein
MSSITTRGQKRKLEEDTPTPLWTLITDYPDIFETHVLLSGYLNGADIKMFYGSCRASRSAVKRAKIKLRERLRVRELSSISTMELAWEGFPWGSRARSPRGMEVTMNQEYFCFRVAETNDLKLLRWVREEKCEVNESTCAAAAKNGHLACLEYLRSKNCPWDKRVCEFAHENNHIDVLAYAVKNKCPGFEAYEQFIPKQ